MARFCPRTRRRPGQVNGRLPARAWARTARHRRPAVSSRGRGRGIAPVAELVQSPIDGLDLIRRGWDDVEPVRLDRLDDVLGNRVRRGALVQPGDPGGATLLLPW